MNLTTQRSILKLKKLKILNSDSTFGELYDGISSLTRNEFITTAKSLRQEKRETVTQRPRGYAIVDEERRKIGITVAQFIPLLDKELERNAKFDPARISSKERRSLVKYYNAVEELLGEDSVAQAAVSVAKRRSFFYSAA